MALVGDSDMGRFYRQRLHGAARTSRLRKVHREARAAREDLTGTTRALLTDARRLIQDKWRAMERESLVALRDSSRGNRPVTDNRDSAPRAEFRPNALIDLAQRAAVIAVEDQVRADGLVEMDRAEVAQFRPSLAVLRGPRSVLLVVDGEEVRGGASPNHIPSTRLHGSGFYSQPRGEMSRLPVADVLDAAHRGDWKIKADWVTGADGRPQALVSFEPGPNSPYSRQAANGARHGSGGDRSDAMMLRLRPGLSEVEGLLETGVQRTGKNEIAGDDRPKTRKDEKAVRETGAAAR